MRFNPPPHWPPAPPGWTPPPGWQPDPSWPPPPPGWQLWVDGSPPSRRTPLLIAGGIAVALLVIIGVVVAVVMSGDDSSVTATGSSSGSDEDQIKATVQSFEDAWNSGNLEAFQPLVCSRLRREYTGGPSSDYTGSDGDFKKVLGAHKLDLTVKSVDINGDEAHVTIASPGVMREIPFVHERDGWKICPNE